MTITNRGEPVKVLTIAGSDSGGAAGLQADLKTFTALRVYGMSVVTAVTAQNSLSVTGLHPIPTDFIALQLEEVLSDYGAAAVKSGFIGRVEAIEAIASMMKTHKMGHIIIDPVLVNHRGQAMFSDSVTRAYVDFLLPLAELVSPNRQEAALLAGMPVESLDQMEKAARAIHDLGPSWILIKGGREGEDMVDLLFDGRQSFLFRSARIETNNTHGSGDTLSAAICAFRAQGLEMTMAVKNAHRFTVAAIQGGASWRLGAGHGPVSHW